MLYVFLRLQEHDLRIRVGHSIIGNCELVRVVLRSTTDNRGVAVVPYVLSACLYILNVILLRICSGDLDKFPLC